MTQEDIIYAGKSIPVELREVFQEMDPEQRMYNILVVTLANNARAAAGLDALTKDEIVLCMQAISAGVPFLCSPNIKPASDIRYYKTPLALLTEEKYKEQVNKYISIASTKSGVRNYYKKSINRFDKTLVEACQDPEFGLSQGKYFTKQCHPMNQYVKKIKSDINHARYIDERAASFLYKAGEYEKPELPEQPNIVES